MERDMKAAFDPPMPAINLFADALFHPQVNWSVTEQHISGLMSTHGIQSCETY